MQNFLQGKEPASNYDMPNRYKKQMLENERIEAEKAEIEAAKKNAEEALAATKDKKVEGKKK